MDYLNLIKMVMYLLVSTIRAVDLFVINGKNNSTSAKGGRKNKKNSNDHSLSEFDRYEAKRYDVLIQICNIMQMPIDKLWQISIAEENFVK